jgi:uncharacterized protein involved in tellurium resistance
MTKTTREVTIYPYTVIGRASYLKDDTEIFIKFSADIEIDEDEFENAKNDCRLSHWCMETPSDLEVYKVETLFDKFDDVDITDVEGDKTKKKIVMEEKNDD